MKLSKNGICTEVGALIYLARKTKGLTQRELSERLGVSRPSIANIEVGRQNLTLVRLFEIAEALGVSPQSLVPTGDVDHRALARRERAQAQVKVLEAKLERARHRAEEV